LITFWARSELLVLM